VTTDQASAFGHLLWQYRRAAGLTQEALAERAGLSVRGVSDLERGARRAPHRETVRLLADALALGSAERASLERAVRRQHGLPTASQARSAALGSHLPAPLTSFVGRERELAEVPRLLGGPRLLTLIGLGGIGKTRLALEVAGAAAAPETAFVDLASLERAAVVPEAVAAALGVIGTPGQDLPTTLAHALQGRPLLLVLDNCEHVISACAELADGLLRACPDLRILATSREPLGVGGETVWTVPPLALPDPACSSAKELGESAAVRLFVERGQSSLPGFILEEANAAWVADICRRLEGIPLALELAAARVRALGVGELARRLDDRLRLLVGGSRDAPARQQTLRATLDWSYALLSEPERVLLARLVVFAGGWTLEAAEAVGGGDGLAREAVLDLLAQLVDRSLVAVEPTRGGGVRYRMLETVRQYAHERLVERGEVDAVQRRHAAFYRDLAERADPELWRPDQVAWMVRLETELGNLRAALEWSATPAGDPELGLRIAAALWRYWPRSGHLHEGRAYLTRLLALHTEPTSIRAWGLQAAAQVAWYAGDLVAARARLRAALAVAKAPAEARTVLWVHVGLGTLALTDGDPTGAEAILQQGLAFSEQAADPPALFVLLWALSNVKRAQGDLMAAQRLLEEALAQIQVHGDHDGIGYALLGLGHLALIRGDFGRAVSLQLEGLAVFQQAVDIVNIPHCLDELAMTAAALGDLAQATRLFAAAATQRVQAGGAPWPLTLAEREGSLAAARAGLGDAAFEAAWQVGRDFSLAQAIAEAAELVGGAEAARQEGAGGARHARPRAGGRRK
jgi:predicted ATPase/DNA-binding XRE family transcriptional regulator